MSADSSKATDGKSKLVYGILKRWSYCLPRKSNGKVHVPEKNYIRCGFDGVFVGVRGDVIGNIIDKRSYDSLTPTYDALMTHSALELQKMLVNGIDAQIADLGSENRGSVSALEKEKKGFARINAASAEERYAKRLAKLAKRKHKL